MERIPIPEEKVRKDVKIIEYVEGLYGKRIKCSICGKFVYPENFINSEEMCKECDENLRAEN